MKFDFSDKVVGGFNFEFARGLSAMDIGAAQIGECFETLERVRNGDFESWIINWSATIKRQFSVSSNEQIVDAFKRYGGRKAAAKARALLEVVNVF